MWFTIYEQNSVLFHRLTLKERGLRPNGYFPLMRQPLRACGFIPLKESMLLSAMRALLRLVNVKRQRSERTASSSLILLGGESLCATMLPSQMSLSLIKDGITLWTVETYGQLNTLVCSNKFTKHTANFLNQIVWKIKKSCVKFCMFFSCTNSKNGSIYFFSIPAEIF